MWVLEAYLLSRACVFLAVGWQSGLAMLLAGLHCAYFASVPLPPTCCQHSRMVSHATAHACILLCCELGFSNWGQATQQPRCPQRTTSNSTAGSFRALPHGVVSSRSCLHACVLTCCPALLAVWPDDHMLEKLDHLGIVVLIMGTPVTQLLVRDTCRSSCHWLFAVGAAVVGLLGGR